MNLKMSTERLINIINMIYDTEGFSGVMEEVEDRLEYGRIRKMNGLYRISTGGWSEDEMLVGALTNMLCRFSRHYCGYVRGGAFYFCEERYATVEMVRVEKYG